MAVTNTQAFYYGNTDSTLLKSTSLHIHLLARTSGSWSSKDGTAQMHTIGLLHTANVSNTSPTAAASRTLT